MTLGLEGQGTCLSLEGTVEAEEGWEPRDQEGRTEGGCTPPSGSSTLAVRWNRLSSLQVTGAWAACLVTQV